MPHGGYHGTVELGGNIIQQGVQDSQGNYQIQGGIDNVSRLDNRPKTTTENIEKAIEDKKKEIEAINIAQSGIPVTLPDGSVTSAPGLVKTNILGSNFVQFPAGGLTGVDAKGLATLQNIQNQQLNNLLKQQQQQQLRDQIVAQATGANLDPVDIEQGLISPFLRKSDFTGDAGDKTFLGINLGSTPTVAATTTNPYTGEKITTTKAREGLSSEDYAKFMAGLYDANPALMEQTFPISSGNLAQPILARLLEGGLGGAGQGIGSFIDSATGAIFKPRGGTVRPSDGGISNIRADNFGEIAPEGMLSKAGSRDRDLPYIHSGEIPSEFLEGFKKFYQNYEGPIVGGAAITGVTLPDGSVVEFGDTGSARVFREYLESLGISQPPATGVDAVKDTPQPTGIPKFDVDKFYASLPQYTQQGIMSPNLSRFTDALRMFPGMA